MLCNILALGAAALALVLGASVAEGQQSMHVKDPEGRPSARPFHAVIKPVYFSDRWLTPVPNAVTGTVLHHEPGGELREHWTRFEMLAPRTFEVEIRGVCASACTLILGS